MNKYQWNVVEKILDEAFEYPEDQRSTFVKQACNKNPELLPEIEALMGCMEKATKEGFLEVESIPRNNVMLTMAGDIANMKRGRIGHYEITGVTGRGGMGIVYKAKRADGLFEQDVAIKVIRLGLETEQNIRRFETEREILSQLNHQNIARLLDGGITEDGIPFLVMEWIDGQPVDEFIKEKQLAIPERLDLFEQICNGVQYAHSNLVVHRDIKPANVLVTNEGTVKILDFGIAKILIDDVDGAMHTKTGHFPMTPEYAAPEQIHSKHVSTATDVYNLGILLYEFLTGKKMRDFSGKTVDEINRIICHGETPKPSSAPENGVTIPADMEQICLKALRKEPEERYGTVQELLEDILRYKLGMPVAARPASISYRMKKFAGRHRGGVLAGASGIIITILFFLALIHQQALTAQERDAARFEAEKSAQISQFLIDLFQVADPAVSGGEQPTALEMLEHGIERAQEAIEINKKAFGPHHVSVASNLNSLGIVYWLKGEFNASAEIHEEALRIRKHHHGDRHSTVAMSLDNLASAIRDGGDPGQALSNYRQALSIREEIFGNNHPLVAATLKNMSIALQLMNDHETAVKKLRISYEIRRNSLPEGHWQIAETESLLGYSLAARGVFDEAEPLLYYGYRLLLKQRGPDDWYTRQAKQRLQEFEQVLAEL